MGYEPQLNSSSSSAWVDSFELVQMMSAPPISATRICGLAYGLRLKSAAAIVSLFIYLLSIIITEVSQTLMYGMWEISVNL